MADSKGERLLWLKQQRFKAKVAHLESALTELLYEYEIAKLKCSDSMIEIKEQIDIHLTQLETLLNIKPTTHAQPKKPENEKVIQASSHTSIQMTKSETQTLSNPKQKKERPSDFFQKKLNQRNNGLTEANLPAISSDEHDRDESTHKFEGSRLHEPVSARTSNMPSIDSPELLAKADHGVF